MKTIEELTKLGVDAAFSELQKTQQESNCTDKPAREAFARAVRDAVLADQPAADVPTWRPIAELPDDEREYVYWDGDEMSWHGNPQEKVDATHFIAPPPKPDPFEAWWKASGYVAEKETARQSWNAALEAKP